MNQKRGPEDVLRFVTNVLGLHEYVSRSERISCKGAKV